MYKLYIGSNNVTGKVDKKTIEEVLNKRFDGYTIVNSIGYWEGKKEKSIIVEIGNTTEKEVVGVVKKLKKMLKQYAIGVQFLPDIKFI
jgi:hypothetical protein